METVWHDGISLIQAIQHLGQWLKPFMLCFSFFGTEYFYLLIMPALLWCVDAKLGMRLGILFLLSASVNNMLKFVFHAPRPFWLNRGVSQGEFEGSFGIPSGHAQNSLVVWGFLSRVERKRRLWPGALALVLMIGLSRLYLGVHFPTDVFGGWLFGSILLWIFLRCEAPAINWLRRCSLAQQVGIALLGSLSLIALSCVAMALLRDWHLPLLWAKNMVLDAPQHHVPPILTPEGAVRPAGALFGLASGIAWLGAHGGYDAHGTRNQKIIRYLVGLLGVVIIWFGLGAIFPRGETLLAYIALYGRYALLGLWIAALAPSVFIYLRLAQRAPVDRRLGD